MQIRIDMITDIDITEELYKVLEQFNVHNVIISNDVENPEIFI